MTQELQKVLAFNKDPQYEVFKAIGEVNSNLKTLAEAVNASKTEEITVKNPEDLKISLDPLQANFDALKTSVEQVTSAIQSIPEGKEINLSGVEKLLKDLVNKPVEKMDMSHMKMMCDILDNILFAVQTTASHSGDGMGHHAEMIKEIKSVSAILNLLNENIATIDIPGIDYEKLGRVIRDNVKIKVLGGGGNGNGPEILAAIQSLGGSASTFSDGRKVVAVTNTAIALGSGACKTVFVTALTSNTDVIVIGSSTVVYTLANRTGKILYPGDSITVSIDNLSKLFINGTVADGVTFSYTN